MLVLCAQQYHRAKILTMHVFEQQSRSLLHSTSRSRHTGFPSRRCCPANDDGDNAGCMSCELMFELESAAPRMWPTPPSFVAQVEGSSAANVTIEYRIFIVVDLE